MRTLSGSSIATPILVGVLATVMEYIHNMNDPDLIEALKRKEFIEQLLCMILPEETEDSFFRHVAPWSFFEKDEFIRRAYIVSASGKLRRVS